MREATVILALLGEVSPVEFFGGAMLLLGLVILVVSARYVWRASAVVRATEQNVLGRSDAGSLVRISGRVTHDHDDVLVAPFSGNECVALRYQVEERRLSVLYIFPWFVSVHEAVGAIAFDIRTPEGSVSVVEPAKTVIVGKDVIATAKADTDPPDRIRTFEQENTNITSSTVWQDRPSFVRPLFRVLSIGTRRYSEQRVELSDEVTVVGRVISDGSGIDPLVVSDRAPSGTVYRMAKTSVGGLCIGVGGLVLGALLLFIS